MAIETLTFTDRLWQVLAESVSCIRVQGNGTDFELYYGNEHPAETISGFEYGKRDLVSEDKVDAFGGTVWARSLQGSGSVRFTTDPAGTIAPYALAGYVSTGYFTP